MPALHDGVLRIRNDHMAAGYVGDAEATQSYFRDGYFYTGDIGHLTPEGVLVITGREKTALNIGGDTVLPEVVEEVITSFPAVSEAGVFRRPTNLGFPGFPRWLSQRDQSTWTRCEAIVPEGSRHPAFRFNSF